MISRRKGIDSINQLKFNENQLVIHERKTPIGINSFFQKLFQTPFSIMGSVRKNRARSDIKKLIECKIPIGIQSDSFFENWVDDMSLVCREFCSFLKDERISFWVGSMRGCKRFHVDMVSYRLLVTYAGQGTELLPNEAADRDAFFKGEPNKKIIRDKSGLSHINKWDVAIFRGGNKGILHRTPDSALEKNASILMRLDEKSFIEEIKRASVDF